MFVSSPSVDAKAEWFRMIMSYLQLESMRLWFHVNPQSSIEDFESAWPMMLDWMMSNATRVAIEQLQTVCQFSLN